MDDFVLSNLHESRNEWSCRLIGILTPLCSEGIRSIFNEAWKLCLANDEVGKYLMTFQNLLSRVPKWNSVIVEEERKRIVERSGCNYLEELISCVHIIQLKVLTCIRVGNKQKKIDIAIPNLDSFIHKVYIHIARKCYSNIYLFEKNISPLLVQKNNRELEMIIQECILNTIRESIPTEDIIRAYMDESVEQDEEVVIENIPEEAPPLTPTITEEIKEPVSVPVVSSSSEPIIADLKTTFADIDNVLDMGTGETSNVLASKNPELLEKKAIANAIQRKLEEEEEDLTDRIRIHTDSIDLGDMDFLDLEKKTPISDDVILDGVETLE
jgi:hypothetical protein